MILAAIGTSRLESFLHLTGVLLIFIFVLAITYFCTRWIARYQKGITANKNIQVIETFRITNNKYLQIVEVGQIYMVIAVCKDTITMLGQLDKEALTWLPDSKDENPVENESFQEILRKIKEKLPRK